MWNFSVTSYYNRALRSYFAALLVGVLQLTLGIPVHTTQADHHATDTPAVATTTQPDTLVTTGAAAAITDTLQETNTNQVTISAIATTSSDHATNTTDLLLSPASSTSDSSSATGTATTQNSFPDAHASSTIDDTTSTITIVNQATSTISETTSASTGDNHITTDDTALIGSGNAYAYTNVVNLTNTNVINANGFMVFLRQLFGQHSIDMRELFNVFQTTSSTIPCLSPECDMHELQYYANNQATLTNNITVTADTGNNHASGSAAAVVSGHAYAAANVTNITNTNVIDSNYLVLTFTNFGDMLGDILLPGAALLEQLFARTTLDSSDTIVTDSTAHINNNLNVTADTGNNEALGGNDNAVLTGQAAAQTNVYNHANTNIIAADDLTLLFRVQGDWSGSVRGLPDNLVWEHTPAGVLITNQHQTSTPHGNITATLIGTSNIQNNITVSAHTGNNTASGSDYALVDSGNAYAAANVTNIANTNVIGRNWSLLVFDIFGDWTGDISFGQSDLWIGGTAETPTTMGPGTAFTYTLTVSNLGDQTINNVRVNAAIDSHLITLQEPVHDMHVGTLAPGETWEHTFAARVADNHPHGRFAVDLKADVHGTGSEVTLENNEEIITVITKRWSSGGNSGIKVTDITPAADVTVTKTVSDAVVAPGESASYTVTLTNQGGPVFGAMLIDTLVDTNGTVVAEQEWDLKTILPEESITITYDTVFASNTPTGTYLNRAKIIGQHRNKVPKHMQPYTSKVATTPITIGTSTPLVLGAATQADSCAPYLTEYLQFGTNNTPIEVKKLQRFLRSYAHLEVPVTGTFDTTTLAAVKAFQRTHQSSVLEPWGLSLPTGYVYFTTQKHINELVCGQPNTFPLSTKQLTEISNYRATRSLAK